MGEKVLNGDGSHEKEYVDDTIEENERPSIEKTAQQKRKSPEKDPPPKKVKMDIMAYLISTDAHTAQPAKRVKMDIMAHLTSTDAHTAQTDRLEVTVPANLEPAHPQLVSLGLSSAHVDGVETNPKSVRAQPKLVKQTSISAFFETTKPPTKDAESSVLPGATLVDETDHIISILKRKRDGKPKYRIRTAPKTTSLKKSRVNSTASSENSTIKTKFTTNSLPGKPKKKPPKPRVRSARKRPGQTFDGRKQILITQLLKPNPKSGGGEGVSEARTKKKTNLNNVNHDDSPRGIESNRKTSI